MQARYYDPVIGRFYSNDPVEYVKRNPTHSFNRYAYASNNPYKYTDPDGKEVRFWGATPKEKADLQKAFRKVKNSNHRSFMRARTLEESKNVHWVVHALPGEAPSNRGTGDEANESNGVGTGSISILDPTKNIESINTLGGQVTNSGEAVLAHEVLGHALDKDLGDENNATAEGSAMAAEDEYKEAVNEPKRDQH